MIKRQYTKTLELIERRRFQLLLLATVMVLVLPAFSGSGLLSEILFVTSMCFLFIQSMVAADVSKSRKRILRVIVIALILLSWLKPVGIGSVYTDVIKLSSFVVFFISVIVYLVKYIKKTKSVNLNVLITSVNIYLLAGITGASLAFIFYLVYPNAYTFPAHIPEPNFVNFLYYSFITMSTVGYGDITPRIPETQTLAYLISVTGQLYVAIIIAFLVGKLLVNPDNQTKDKSENS